MTDLLNHPENIIAAILFVIGLANLLLQPNLLKKVIGLNVMDTAVYLFLTAQGYIEGRMDPIVKNGIVSMDAYANPVPAGLVLTGIVVSVSFSAIMLALIIRLYKKYHSLDLDEIMALIEKEGK